MLRNMTMRYEDHDDEDNYWTETDDVKKDPDYEPIEDEDEDSDTDSVSDSDTDNEMNTDDETQDNKNMIVKTIDETTTDESEESEYEDDDDDDDDDSDIDDDITIHKYTTVVETPVQSPILQSTPSPDGNDKLEVPRFPRHAYVTPSRHSIARCYFARILLLNASSFEDVKYKYEEVMCSFNYKHLGRTDRRRDPSKHTMKFEFLFPIRSSYRQIGKGPYYTNPVYVNIMNVDEDDFSISEVWDKSYYSMDTLASLALASTKQNVVYTHDKQLKCYSYWLKVPNYVFTRDDYSHVRKNMITYVNENNGMESVWMRSHSTAPLRFILHSLEYTQSTFSWFKDEINHEMKYMYYK